MTASVVSSTSATDCGLTDAAIAANGRNVTLTHALITSAPEWNRPASVAVVVTVPASVFPTCRIIDAVTVAVAVRVVPIDRVMVAETVAFACRVRR